VQEPLCGALVWIKSSLKVVGTPCGFVGIASHNLSNPQTVLIILYKKISFIVVVVVVVLCIVEVSLSLGLVILSRKPKLA
jgi:hypothetical protein